MFEIIFSVIFYLWLILCLCLS
ncbi:protein of unknown function [Rhodovastum atsumiense]|nr:protein of unknown function [Rhodovastum atsumiense]